MGPGDHPRADRAALFSKAVHEIDRVPAGGPSNDVTALQGLLHRHFSYDDEATTSPNGKARAAVPRRT